MGECIEWQGKRVPDGYGYLQLHGKSKYAHRLAYEEAHGVTLARGQVILHTCDNPPCVNPEHLRLGTQRDNIADMVAKGRNARGFMFPHTKLSMDQVAEIRQLKRDGMKQVDIARAYGVSTGRISEIVNFKSRVR